MEAVFRSEMHHFRHEVRGLLEEQTKEIHELAELIRRLGGQGGPLRRQVTPPGGRSSSGNLPMPGLIYGSHPTPLSEVPSVGRCLPQVVALGIRGFEEALEQRLLHVRRQPSREAEPFSGAPAAAGHGFPSPQSGDVGHAAAVPEVSNHVLVAMQGLMERPAFERVQAGAVAVADEAEEVVAIPGLVEPPLQASVVGARSEDEEAQGPPASSHSFSFAAQAGSPEMGAVRPCSSFMDQLQEGAGAPQAVGGGSKERRARVAWSMQVESLDPVTPSQGPVDKALSPRSVSNFTAARGSLDTLRRAMELEILKTTTTSAPSGALAVPQLPDCAGFLKTTASAAASSAARFNRAALCFGGVLPWSQGHSRSSRVYQAAVLVVHVAILAGLGLQTRASLSTGIDLPFVASDLVLVVGCVAGVLALSSSRFQISLEMLEESNKTQQFESSVEAKNAVDTLVTLLVWLAFVADRLGFLAATAPGGLATLPWAQALRIAGVIVSSAQLSILVLAVLRMTRNMVGLVDAFCTKFLQRLDAAAAVDDWNVVQASVRMASAAVEGCFAILMSVLVTLALATTWDIQSLQGAVWAVSSPGLLILATSQILLRAAAVTDSCVRISQLVNSTPLGDNPMDAQRLYLVDYIAASEAGFYAYNVRLGAGFGIKVLHYTGLMTFTLARLLLPLGGSF